MPRAKIANDVYAMRASLDLAKMENASQRKDIFEMGRYIDELRGENRLLRDRIAHLESLAHPQGNAPALGVNFQPKDARPTGQGGTP